MSLSSMLFKYVTLDAGSFTFGGIFPRSDSKKIIATAFIKKMYRHLRLRGLDKDDFELSFGINEKNVYNHLTIQTLKLNKVYNKQDYEEYFY